MPRTMLALDFDGVCHQYTSGWQGAAVIPDPPVEGLFVFLEAAYQHFDIAIYSSRSHQPGGIEAMMRWFVRHAPWFDMPEGTDTECRWYGPGRREKVRLTFPMEKPSAFLTIDDRAICFQGVWPEVQQLLQFKPWNKR